MNDITELLAAQASGELDGMDQLMAAVYPDLRRIAHAHMRRERSGNTLNTTVVVHEAYLRLVDQTSASWRDRAHFFAVASRIMRHILIDHARERLAAKRGGGAKRVPFTDNFAADGVDLDQFLVLEAALSELGRRDSRLEQVVECRFFGGMTAPETAQALDVSLRTVERDWTRAKAYLYRSLREDPDG